MASRMFESPEIYVCWRIADLPDPRPESLEDACDKCRHGIWVMPGAPNHMPKLCRQCAKAWFKTAFMSGEGVFVLPGAMGRAKPH